MRTSAPSRVTSTVCSNCPALEEELGTRLFERTPKGMRLLPPGEEFLKHARDLLAGVEEAVRKTQRVAGLGA